MRGFILLFALILSAAFPSCDTCSDCVPVTSNPFIAVNFRQNSDEASVDIILQTLNGVNAENILLIGEDTLSNNFRFPIDLNRDEANYEFEFFLTTDTLRETLNVGTLEMTYRRSEIINERRRVSLSIDSIELVSSSFLRDTLICSEPTNCTGDAHAVSLFL